MTVSANQIVVGQIIKAQGLKGEVKVKPLTSDSARFKRLKSVTIGPAAFRVLNARIDGSFVFLRLMGVDTRESAEALRDKFIAIDRAVAEIEEDEYFIVDLIGCVLLLDGLRIGLVENVLQHGAADVFSISLDSGKTMMFPFLNSLCLQIDIEKREIRAQKNALDAVAVYED